MCNHCHDRVPASPTGVGIASATDAVFKCDRHRDKFEVRMGSVHRVYEHFGQRHFKQTGLYRDNAAHVITALSTAVLLFTIGPLFTIDPC